jgi:hypothetical protein
VTGTRSLQTPCGRIRQWHPSRDHSTLWLLRLPTVILLGTE